MATIERGPFGGRGEGSRSDGVQTFNQAFEKPRQNGTDSPAAELISGPGTGYLGAVFASNPLH